MRYLARTIQYENIASPVRLVLFSDTHVGSSHFARKKFKQFLSSAMDHPNAWCMGIGDQIDCIIPSDQKRFQMSAIDPQYRVSEKPDELLDLQCEDFVSLLDPYKDRLLGLLEGNHEEQVRRRYSTSIHRQICTKLECENLGRSCLLLLKLSQNGARGRNVTLYAHHGFGTGTVSEGYSITKYSRLIYSYDADIFITAHDHQCWVKRMARIGITNTGKMQDKDIILCNTGAFKKSLSDSDVPSWEETKGFPPRQIGGLIFDLRVEAHGWVDMKLVE